MPNINCAVAATWVICLFILGEPNSIDASVICFFFSSFDYTFRFSKFSANVYSLSCERSRFGSIELFRLSHFMTSQPTPFWFCSNDHFLHFFFVSIHVKYRMNPKMFFPTHFESFNFTFIFFLTPYFPFKLTNHTIMYRSAVSFLNV